MNAANLSLQYGEAYNHSDSYEFIAQELLQYGSFIINFVDKQDNYIPILISYPRALFVKERYIYITINNQSIIPIALDSENTMQNVNLDQELSEFIQGIRNSLRQA